MEMFFLMKTLFCIPGETNRGNGRGESHPERDRAEGSGGGADAGVHRGPAAVRAGGAEGGRLLHRRHQARSVEHR